MVYVLTQMSVTTVEPNYSTSEKNETKPNTYRTEDENNCSDPINGTLH